MADFICMDWVDLQGMRSNREIQNENFFPTVGFEPTHDTVHRLEGRRLSTRQDQMKGTRFAVDDISSSS